jgi:hypothetical protein
LITSNICVQSAQEAKDFPEQSKTVARKEDTLQYFFKLINSFMVIYKHKFAGTKNPTLEIAKKTELN